MPTNSFVNYPMSWKPDKEKLKRPVYLSLAERLEQDIASGQLAPGTKLPPQRELADFLDLNFTTITRAYKLCELKGLLYAVMGSGTFVSPNAARSVTISLDSTPQEYIELGFVASFEQSNHLVAETAKKVTEKRYLEQLLHYDHPTGLPHQKMAAISWMQQFGMQAKPDQTAIVSGAQNALAVTLFALFQPRSRIAVDRYTYSNFIELAKGFHIHLVPIDGDGCGMLPDELENQCRLNKIQGIFLMPSCSNPTTVVMTEKRKHELAAVIRKYGLILIEDDIYAFLTAGILPDYRQPMAQLLPERSVYISGISKSLCSGLRVAYLVFSPVFREKILKSIFNINVKTSSLDAEIITELILTGKANEIASMKKELAESANRIFFQVFPEADKQGHPLSFYRWMSVPEKTDAIQLVSTLQNRGVRVFDSNRFLVGSNTAVHSLRVALASTDSFKKLEQGLLILKESL